MREDSFLKKCGISEARINRYSSALILSITNDMAMRYFDMIHELESMCWNWDTLPDSVVGRVHYLVGIIIKIGEANEVRVRQVQV